MASYFEDITPARTAPSAGIKSIPRPKPRPKFEDPLEKHFKMLGQPNPFAGSAKARRNVAQGGLTFTGIRDMFDGGGPGRSGSRFFMRDTALLDENNDGYISEAESEAYKAEDRPAYNRAVGGIGAVSNFSGARPRGSYAQERDLGPRGTNIGTSGIANYITGGGPLGALFGGGKPNTMQRAQPQMDVNQRFTYDNLRKFMTDQQAREFLGSNYSPPAPSTYTSTDYLMDASRYNPPMNMNMGGIMQLANFGRSV